MVHTECYGAGPGQAQHQNCLSLAAFGICQLTPMITMAFGALLMQTIDIST